MLSPNLNTRDYHNQTKQAESDIQCYRNLTVWKDGRHWRGLRRRDIPRSFLARFHSKYQKLGGCWLWQAGKFYHGYGQVNLGRDAAGKQHTEYAHRVAYVLAVGDVPAGAVVMHTCDTPACVNPDHLRLGTQAENVLDASQKGKYLRGLTVGSVRWIREQRRSGAWPKRGKPGRAA